MKLFAYGLSALMLAALLTAMPAHAQLGEMLGQGAKGLTGGSSLSSGSLGNVAGLLQYCVTNNFINGGQDVNSVQDKLMGKLPGGAKSEDPGYNDGLKGMLHSKDGKSVDLSEGGTGGIQDQVKKQVCDTVLSQAKSFL